ncbi:MAG: glycerol-3-phosphate 1-O-acyltransferase PlsY [Pseudomonadota bacterium]
MQNDIIILILSYLIGSIPFGLVISYIAGHGDIRKIGSGNIGTTNVLRTGNKFLAFLTLLADSSKVILAILFAKFLGYSLEYYVATAAFLGHLFPIWLKFRGGKGVASFLGLSLYLFPKIAALLASVWIITFVTTRYSSLAAIFAAIAGMIVLPFALPIDKNLYLVLTLILLILIKHKDNIRRLLNGEESKFKKD